MEFGGGRTLINNVDNDGVGDDVFGMFKDIVNISRYGGNRLV